MSHGGNAVYITDCERSELSNTESILMMCVRMYVHMYVSVTLRNAAVMSCRNVASMMRILTSYSYIMAYWNFILLTIIHAILILDTAARHMA